MRTRAPRAARFIAVFAAPPGTQVLLVMSTTGAGPSRLMRPASPRHQPSSMTSPMTVTRGAAALMRVARSAGNRPSGCSRPSTEMMASFTVILPVRVRLSGVQYPAVQWAHGRAAVSWVWARHAGDGCAARRELPGMTTSVLAPLSPRFDNVRSIAVLRGGGLGDLLFAMPALAALQHAYPGAEITLLGTPVAAELLRGQQLPHEVAVLPPTPGVRPATAAEPEDPARRDRFIAELRQRRFDLAVQLHGGGDNSNPLLLAIGARHTVGSRTSTSAELERSIPYRIYQHEMLRGLELVGLAGGAPVALEPHLTPTPTARRAARSVLHGSAEPGRRPLLVLHPGATDPRRRWPVESFAELAARAVRGGVRLRVVGAEDDADAAERIVQAARDADG